MLANNEVGTIQPIRELCAVAHERGVLFHTDAVQAVGKIPVDVEELGVDLLTLSGAQVPRAEGRRRALRAQGRRAGAAGPRRQAGGRAARRHRERGRHRGHGQGGRAGARASAPRGATDRARCATGWSEGIRELVPDALLNGHPTSGLPNTLNLTLPGLRGESLVVALDQHGISLSSGSACKSGSPEPTHVLLAMGRTEEEAHCSVRFSLSHDDHRSRTSTRPSRPWRACSRNGDHRPLPSLQVKGTVPNTRKRGQA